MRASVVYHYVTVCGGSLVARLAFVVTSLVPPLCSQYCSQCPEIGEALLRQS